MRSALIQQCTSNILKDISKITMMRIGRNMFVKIVDMLALKAPSLGGIWKECIPGRTPRETPYL